MKQQVLKLGESLSKWETFLFCYGCEAWGKHELHKPKRIGKGCMHPAHQLYLNIHQQANVLKAWHNFLCGSQKLSAWTPA